MKLEFDSMQELEQFLMFSAHIGRAFQTAPASVEPVKVTSEASSLADQSFAASVLAVDDGEQSIRATAQNRTPGTKNSSRQTLKLRSASAARRRKSKRSVQVNSQTSPRMDRRRRLPRRLRRKALQVPKLLLAPSRTVIRSP